MRTRSKFLIGLILLTVMLFTASMCGHEVKQIDPIIITDEMVMWAADRFVLLPEHPDTLHFTITGTLDDNTLLVRCDTDSTEHWMEVESAYIPQYYEGNTFTLIQIHQ